MNDDITTAVKVLAVLGALAVLIWFGVIAIRAARRGGGGMRGIGASMMILGWGFMRDPRNDTVAEAQEGQTRKGTHSGDPLDRDPRSPQD
jgi:hypothetical protein